VERFLDWFEQDEWPTHDLVIATHEEVHGSAGFRGRVDTVLHGLERLIDGAEVRAACEQD